MNGISRVLYLADRYRTRIPKTVASSLPYGDIIREVSELGSSGAAVNLRLSNGQLTKLVEEGSEGGDGSEEELRLLIADLALGEMELRKEDMEIKEYLRFLDNIKAFSDGHADLVQIGEIDLGTEDDTEVSIPKFKTGFEPLDILTGGVYQGITIMMGKPGHGKTSILLSIMETLRYTEVASSIWFYNVEIPREMMLYKIRPMRRRTQFTPEEDILYCGYYSLPEIIKAVQDDPNPDRVLIIDGPDAMTGAAGEGRRFALEAFMIELVKVKELLKWIVISSQVRRKDRHITLESGAEAWAKAWYADISVGITKIGGTRDSQVKMRIVKNRFGPSDREGIFKYDFTDLIYEDHSMQDDDW